MEKYVAVSKREEKGENASSEQAEHFGIRTRWPNLLYGRTILCCGSGL